MNAFKFLYKIYCVDIKVSKPVVTYYFLANFSSTIPI